MRAVAPDQLVPLIGRERGAAFMEMAREASRELAGTRVLNVNSTATGGGVAELLQTMVAYARGAGIDAGWAVIKGDARFFEITKRLHNHLYGTAGDRGPLGPEQARAYAKTARRNVADLLALIQPGDAVILHDPQTAALIEPLRDAGAKIVWRCHVGIDTQNEWSEEAWEFLRPYAEAAHVHVFSRAQFAPAWIPPDALAVIPPSIDPFSAKNEPVDEHNALRTLQFVGLLAGEASGPPSDFTRRDGSRGHIERRVDLLGTGPPPGPEEPLVVQASRWDALKDMPGVMLGFAEHVSDTSDAHLLVTGPEARGVADDPEANGVLAECRELWTRFSPRVRERIHLACVPMVDPDEAAAIVNAIQRHATVVVQKSLAEGFGLTVAEAMWKSRPVVGTAVGGITEQIVPGATGHLLADPADLDAYARAVSALLVDAGEANRMGANGYERVRLNFLADRHLTQWADLFGRLADS